MESVRMAMIDAHALIIGIANYQQINSLPTTVLDDARDIQQLLIDPKLGGYAPANVQLLLDDQATLEGLRNGLSELAGRSTQQSTVFIYLSSHGGRIESGTSAGEYILPVDTQYASEATLASSALSGPELTRALNAIKARKVVVAFDCCHSGGIGQPKDAAGVVVKQGLPSSYYTALQAGTGRVILASSRDTELSWVLPGAKNSLFTQHLLAGLRGGIPSPDGLVRIFNLFEYIQPRVTHDQPNQHPIFKAQLEDNFAIALCLGGTKDPGPPGDADGFLFDAYISYVDRDPDATWVWEVLVPMLEAAQLRVAVSGDVEEAGVSRVVGIERGVTQAKRTIAVLSQAYLTDHLTTFIDTLAVHVGIEEGAFRLLPVVIDDVDLGRLPKWISSLVILNMAHPRRAERAAKQLVNALQGPLPRF